MKGEEGMLIMAGRFIKAEAEKLYCQTSTHRGFLQCITGDTYIESTSPIACLRPVHSSPVTRNRYSAKSYQNHCMIVHLSYVLK